METKACSRCGATKPRADFHKRKASADGLQPACKLCQRQVDREVYRKVREKTIARATEWRKKNPERYRSYRRGLQARKLKTNPNFRLSRMLRTRLYHALHGAGVIKTGSAIKLLGCTIDQLRGHLETLFQPGMTWGNHGEWHIDHVRPLASFDLSDSNQLVIACHYTNLQPLWKVDNLRKGGRT